MKIHIAISLIACLVWNNLEAQKKLAISVKPNSAWVMVNDTIHQNRTLYYTDQNQISVKAWMQNKIPIDTLFSVPDRPFSRVELQLEKTPEMAAYQKARNKRLFFTGVPLVAVPFALLAIENPDVTYSGNPNQHLNAANQHFQEAENQKALAEASTDPVVYQQHLDMFEDQYEAYQLELDQYNKEMKTKVEYENSENQKIEQRNLILAGAAVVAVGAAVYSFFKFRGYTKTKSQNPFLERVNLGLLTHPQGSGIILSYSL